MEKDSLPAGWPCTSGLFDGEEFPNSLVDAGSACPICFSIMKPPHLAPIVLSPCGHTFCAKCVAVHTAVQRKKARLQGGPIDDPPCPHCKKRIVAQSVNVTLQNIITERLSLRQIVRQAEVQSMYPKLPVRGQQLYEDLLTPARTSGAARDNFGTREYSAPGLFHFQSLQDVLSETKNRQERLEGDLATAEQKVTHLECKEKELKEVLQKVSMEYRMLQTELEDTKSKQKMLYQAHAETLQKADLIEASVVALKKEHEDFNTLQTRESLTPIPNTYVQICDLKQP